MGSIGLTEEEIFNNLLNSVRDRIEKLTLKELGELGDKARNFTRLLELGRALSAGGTRILFALSPEIYVDTFTPGLIDDLVLEFVELLGLSSKSVAGRDILEQLQKDSNDLKRIRELGTKLTFYGVYTYKSFNWAGTIPELDEFEKLTASVVDPGEDDEYDPFDD